MLDPITLEVLRCKFEAIAEDGSRTIIRNAISPVVVESKDCSCALYSPDGDLVVGGGKVQIAFHAGGSGVRAIKAIHGNSLAPGDIFLVNDPYNGGGLHAQDVVVHMPIFADDRLVAWVGASAHMVDMGGMVPGSFSTSATECYQEALRLPPVRIARQGVEQADVWAILKNNIRMANIVEMDMRSLIAGANVVREQVIRVVEDYGAEVFIAATEEFSRLTETEVRRRISEIEPGVYVARSWSEWTGELYEIPCALHVENGTLLFDYSGASAQSKHYFNSTPNVIRSLLGVGLAPYVALGLPFNEGLFRAFELRCDPGSILDARPPAPIGGPHLDIGQNAMEVGLRALNLALAASPRSRARRHLAGPSVSSGTALHTIAGLGTRGEQLGALMLDGALTGSSAANDRDAINLSRELVGNGQLVEIADVEVLESWYPVQFKYRRLRQGTGGAGQYCGGRPNSAAYMIDGTRDFKITIMGNRERVPIAGTAGGLPGYVTEFKLRRDGADRWEPLACHQDNVSLTQGDIVAVEAINGGGWGDPLERDPALVSAEVRRGLVTLDEAREVYGVAPDDGPATEHLRKQALEARLARSTPATRPLIWTPELHKLAEGVRGPLAIGVEQRGGVAVSERSGAPLAVSPASWTDGCPRIHGFVPSSPDVDIVAYLDPMTGHLLVVDVALAGGDRSFEVRPTRWSEVQNHDLAAE